MGRNSVRADILYSVECVTPHTESDRGRHVETRYTVVFAPKTMNRRDESTETERTERERQRQETETETETETERNSELRLREREQQ